VGGRGEFGRLLGGRGSSGSKGWGHDESRGQTQTGPSLEKETTKKFAEKKPSLPATNFSTRRQELVGVKRGDVRRGSGMVLGNCFTEGEVDLSV